MIIEEINDDYEWLQYNDQLKLIRSKKDNLYQVQSILNSCKSNRKIKSWFENKHTQELLQEIGSGRILPDLKLYENRPNLPNNLKGMYVHKLLVNHIAMWASPKYSLIIMQLLDEYFQKEREEQKPRLVPKNRELDYQFLIWKEEIPNCLHKVNLHLVKRHKDYMRFIKDKIEDAWYFKENLPIVMTPNRDIKELIKKNFGSNFVEINGSVITISKNKLNDLKELIDEYIEHFQE